ncbi:MAG: N-acetylgalactosamine-6-sulfate sulfatase [Verrucomicrobia bacterium]|nr:N-acetylgalactosamine-6-sulfate sulfatase [Verrucomicrobiota bacterium]
MKHLPLLGCAILLLTFLAPLAGAAAPGPLRPNFVVILADDMGYGDTSVNGGSIKTPQLERLAAQGRRFTDFHSSGNVCSPTRAGLLTGRYQQRAGIDGVVYATPNHPAYFSGLQPIEATLPELLKSAGYSTALFGKWHLGYFPRYNPLHHGFDEFRGYVSGNVDYHSHLDNQGRPDWWNGLKLESAEGYSTHLITQYAEEFLRRRHERPFFLYVAHEAVHDPYQGPHDAAQRARGGAKTKADRRPVAEVYRAMMAELDRGVGVILDTLEATGQAANTFVFFFSDNGANRNGSNGGLRGFKGSDWEGGHRVPAIAWWPGRIKPGVSDQLAISLDLMPTMLAFAGLAAPTARPLDGMSLTSHLLENQPLPPRQLFWNGRAMRDGPWKFIVDAGQPHLFNLQSDLGEKNNLAAQEPERVQRMLARLEEWKADVDRDATPQPKSRMEVQ